MMGLLPKPYVSGNDEKDQSAFSFLISTPTLQCFEWEGTDS
jgi:hypothetical protein